MPRNIAIHKSPVKSPVAALYLASPNIDQEFVP